MWRTISKKMLSVIIQILCFSIIIILNNDITSAASRYNVNNTRNYSGADIINEARKWSNKGCIYWSGITPWEKSVAWRTGYTVDGQTSFDCSGFVGRVLNDSGFRSSNYTPPYGNNVLKTNYGNGFIGISIEELVNYGININDAVMKAKNGDYSGLQAGDVIGWTSGSLGRHIIFYAGLNQRGRPSMVEFTGSGFLDREVSMSYQNSFQFGARFTTNSNPITHDPIGYFDSVTSDQPGTITVRGWAFDRDNLSKSLKIHVYAGGPAGSGAQGYEITADKSRPDVQTVYPGVGNDHGFSDTISINRTGTIQIYVYAINTDGGVNNPQIGVKTVTVKEKSAVQPANADDKKNQIISVKDSITKTYGAKSFKLGAVLTTGNGKLSYKTSNKKVATVSSKGKITIKGTGRTVITITASGTSSYKETSKTVIISVKPKKIVMQKLQNKKKGVIKVTWNPVSKADGYQIQASTNKNFTDASSFTVSVKGTTKKAKSVNVEQGTKYYVRVRAFKGEVYGSWSKYKSIKSSGKAQKKMTMSVTKAGGSTVTASITNVGSGTIEWKSSAPSVATVRNGVITAVDGGNTVITATVKRSGVTSTITKTITVKKETEVGQWSNWSTEAVSATATREVRTTPLYRYYCFYCPVCGGREPFTGTSDCHSYTLSLSNAQTRWSEIPYSASNPQSYSYTTAKKYTESLGDGLRWNFSTGNLYDTAIGTKDYGADGAVITTGYSYRNVNKKVYISDVR